MGEGMKVLRVVFAVLTGIVVGVLLLAGRVREG